VSLPLIFQQVGAHLIARLLATLSNLLVMASASLLLFAQPIVKDALTRQQHALSARRDGILLEQFATQAVTIPSQQKHSEESSTVRLLAQDNMSGGIRAVLLLALTPRPMVLMQWLGQL